VRGNVAENQRVLVLTGLVAGTRGSQERIGTFQHWRSRWKGRSKITEWRRHQL